MNIFKFNPNSSVKLFIKVNSLHLLKKIIRKHHNKKECGSLVYGEHVYIAKKQNLPIVALESAIITHGMPYPDNLETSLGVEDEIRKKGAVPATMAILNGKLCIGLNPDEIENLAKRDKKNLIKISRRDLSYAVSNCKTGGTTVSSTMLMAKLAEIPILATGGIGGVHRQADITMDISTDLRELGQTSVVVVCSGVKAILDIPKTLEFLETEGVPVVTIGSNDEFPAFYSTQTSDGLKSPMRVSNAVDAASLIKTHLQLKLNSGILLAVPIPKIFSLDPQYIQEVIKEALETAKELNISGKKVTPFLLEELSRLTVGLTLQSNKGLVKNNAAIAAEIAVNLKRIEHNPEERQNFKYSEKSTSLNKLVVIGGSTYDTVLRVKASKIVTLKKENILQ